ncbi:MFS transporter [Gorillibacterium massiliense]|uniref:MFS transporter n=1 Tax=Gorillibacterium massiliense TaxID=1280390 RepID=UPI0004B33797|nr:MFS transporter [Gorillibacterium massiliense]
MKEETITLHKASKPASVFSSRVFSRMFLSYSISSIGDWFDVMAMIVLFTYVWNASPLIVSSLSITYAIPSILLSQYTGVLADRLPKQKIMVISDWVRALFTLFLIFAPNVYWALPIVFLRATASVFNTPAQQALIRHVVPEEQLLQATTLNTVVNQMAKVIGPLIGSALLTITTPKVCLAINAVSFTISALILMTIRRVNDKPEAKEQANVHKNLFGAIHKGWSVLLVKKMLWISTIFYMLCLFVLLISDSQIGVLLRKVEPHHSELLGIIMASVSIGIVLVGGFFTKVKQLNGLYGWFFGGGSIAGGVFFFGLGLVQEGTNKWLYAAGAMLGGMGIGTVMMVFNYLVQKETPKEMIGRVAGIVASLSSLVFILGPLLGGVLVTRFGAQFAFRVSGISVLAIGFLGILLQKVIWKKTNEPAKVSA